MTSLPFAPQSAISRKDLSKDRVPLNIANMTNISHIPTRIPANISNIPPLPLSQLPPLPKLPMIQQSQSLSLSPISQPIQIRMIKPTPLQLQSQSMSPTIITKNIIKRDRKRIREISPNNDNKDTKRRKLDIINNSTNPSISASLNGSGVSVNALTPKPLPFTVYDTKDKKYYDISGMPRNDQLYVWPGYDNYFKGIGREFDAYRRITGGGDGFISDVDYYLYSKEIMPVGNLAQFYMEQNAKDFWCHVLENKLKNQFKKNGKARKLQFFENVDGKIWRHFIKKKLSDYEENIDVDDGGHVKRWNLSFDQANNLFPVNTGSLFSKVIGIRKHYVDDMDFVFDIKRNKLRIYSVILTENTKTHAINGNDIEKR